MPTTISLIQAAASVSPAANLEAALAKAEQATRDGMQIIFTQELFATQYFCQIEFYEYFAWS